VEERPVAQEKALLGYRLIQAYPMVPFDMDSHWLCDGAMP
jgi:hypothetical protein